MLANKLLYNYCRIPFYILLSKFEIHRVTEQLKSLGCTAREAQIYMQCLRIGPASVQEIARQLKQNRITIHSAVEQLIEKELLFETRRGKRRLIVADEPVALFRLLQKKEDEIKKARENLKYLTPLLASLQSVDQSAPTARFYEGPSGFKRMLEETLCTRGEVLVFSYVDLFSKLVGAEYLERHFKQRAAKGIHARLIFPQCPIAERLNSKARELEIQIRFLPKTFVWQSGIFSWNDCIALTSYTEQKLTCTIIENRDIAHFYRTIIFEMCWNQAIPARSGTS